MGEWDAPHLTSCDEDIMPLVDMCNIACGGHAGSKRIIQTTIDLANANNVKVGAHPSFEDRPNFGRKYISISQIKLKRSLTQQLELFLSICYAQSINAFHVKAHGALYHACNQNKKEAETLVSVILKLCPDILVLVAPDSKLEKIARSEGIKTMTESFIDRKYNDDLTLVSRTNPESVIQDIKEAKKQYEALCAGKIITKSGEVKILNTSTVCIHGDNPQCVKILKSIRSNG